MKKANECYLIDKEFCDFIKRRIAVVMGKVASLPDPGNCNAEILDNLADVRNCFDWKLLREHSDSLKNSIDMKRFIDPSKPIIE